MHTRKTVVVATVILTTFIASSAPAGVLNGPGSKDEASCPSCAQNEILPKEFDYLMRTLGDRPSQRSQQTAGTPRLTAPLKEALRLNTAISGMKNVEWIEFKAFTDDSGNLTAMTSESKDVGERPKANQRLTFATMQKNKFYPLYKKAHWSGPKDTVVMALSDDFSTATGGLIQIRCLKDYWMDDGTPEQWNQKWPGMYLRIMNIGGKWKMFAVDSYMQPTQEVVRMAAQSNKKETGIEYLELFSTPGPGVAFASLR